MPYNLQVSIILMHRVVILDFELRVTDALSFRVGVSNSQNSEQASNFQNQMECMIKQLNRNE